MNKKIITIIIATVLVIGAGISFAIAAGVLNIKMPTWTVDVRKKLVLDVADTDATRELGLGGRDAMAQDHGMIFNFGASGIYPFWMKGMKFPLDIIWINKGIVQEVVRLNPPVNAKVMPDTHTPIHQADQVLEVNAGVAGQLGIKPGVRILLP